MLLRFAAVSLVVLSSTLLTLIIALDAKILAKIKISFGLLALGVGGWLAFSVFSDLELNNALLINRLVFVFPVLALIGTLFFSRSFWRPRRGSHSLFLDLTLSLAALLTALSPYVITGISPRISSKGEFVGNNVVRGPLYPLFLFFVVTIASIAIARLVIYYRHSNRMDKRKVKFILYGFLATIVLGMFTNVVMPLILGNSSLSVLGIMSGAVFIGSVALSITKYQFLDIRPVIARAASYFLVLGLLFLGYTGTAAILVSNIDLNNTFAGPVLLSVLLISATLLYAPLKGFFDRTTNRVFYKDAYDPQVFLDRLNRILVSTIELDLLLRNSSQAIEETLKAQFCAFGLKETKFRDYRIVRSGAVHTFEEKDIRLVRSETPHIHKRIIVTDELDEKHNKLRHTLIKNDIAILVRITSDVERDREGAGYLVLGSKKSGFIYSEQDKRLLETAINAITIAIQNALRFEEIQNFNITLQKEIKKATHQLREANQRLRVLDRTKDDFISMASHQLRTPLTSVKGYLSMTLEGDGGAVNDKQRKLLNQAFISSQRMVYLIADMLNVSRLKTGKFVIEPEPTDLADVVQTEIEQLKGTAEARGLKLTYNRPSNFPTLTLDQTKIRQVIMNFVDNAIYYTPSGGHIDVVLKDTGSAIEFTVTDDGIGVPKHERHHLFNKFYRAGNAKKARPDGTGLGLYMAKKVIIAQGGSIIFHSQEGKGSTFGFTIAKAKLQSGPTIPVPIEEPRSGSEKKSNVETTT